MNDIAIKQLSLSISQKFKMNFNTMNAMKNAIFNTPENIFI